MDEPKKTGAGLDVLGMLRASDMTNDALREIHNSSSMANAAKMFSEMSSARALTEKFQQPILADFESMSQMKQFIDPYRDMEKFGKLNAAIEAATGLTDLTAAGVFSKQLDRYRDIAKQLTGSFHRPDIAEACRLFADEQSNGGAVAAYARQHLNDFASQKALAASISQPWMKELEALRSANALIELHGLGSALKSVHGFDEALTTALRTDLGDWRDRISFPAIIFDNPLARTDFYVARGFDTSLTDFPEDTFSESLVLVGLDDFLDEGMSADVVNAADSIEAAAFRRNEKCYDCLQRLERRLRQFINQAMTAQYGVDWPKARLAPVMLESWEEKKSRAKNNGVILTMFIDVADFTDYEAIICRKEHWRDVFQSRFQRKESVLESFQRLRPIRVDTMHARFVTKDDVLYVFAESTRLLRAIA